MKRATFDFLCTKLYDKLQRSSVVREALSVEHRVVVAIYFLASTAEYRTIGNLFGIHKSTVHSCVHDVCDAIVALLFPAFVTFLKGQGLKEIIRGFQETWNFPNCAGAIDATHIPIIAPKEDHADYVNRKGWYSIILQAVCDHRYRFTDICIGWPGRVHDARVFANSQLMAQAVNGNLLPSSPEWTQAVGPTDDNIDMPVILIGDAEYPMF
ncbi:putative nuclease HARBI1 [Gigantopelta aegis]|uniref:putative nuclease HARBI1 n=1 Tax=Gigantopelta aegis TaxID=1735272 RepID=UPI001B887633|nr:putative nuclease HARBI1 [Gigantopelta aegis]